MNKYTYYFTTNCPNNNEAINYKLVAESNTTIMVEDIIDCCYFFRFEYQEDIADKLLREFRCKITLTATHQGVKIKTVRQ